ncbi:ribbon-helix-helix domain-containing protein [Kiloniella laminariae]|uniref:Ribbon-helix-helix domain-containing protein n=1 Tax=Kiloniella laminariae TaxID=454162 RepID=A0ABT4LMP7_9PROT|nr:ribbon-helix-helix domain-containing protein [Kiloniella laminariae]MCZ4282165.1 ribbon-helix-helix domain-containing protein [Kiloniella laminariae]
MSTLVNKNVSLEGRRTSVRMEPEMWEALFEICVRENRPLGEICTLVDEARDGASFTTAIRVFILIYFKNASTYPGDSLGDFFTLTSETV